MGGVRKERKAGQSCSLAGEIYSSFYPDVKHPVQGGNIQPIKSPSIIQPLSDDDQEILAHNPHGDVLPHLRSPGLHTPAPAHAAALTYPRPFAPPSPKMHRSMLMQSQALCWCKSELLYCLQWSYSNLYQLGSWPRDL